MRLIDLHEKKPIISPEALTIKEFANLWQRDKTAKKERAMQEIAFIYWKYYFASPYRVYDRAEKDKKITKDVISIPNWKPDKLVKAAGEKYEELQATPSIGLLEDAESAVMKLRGYFRTVNLKSDSTGTISKNLISNLSNLDGIVKGLKNLRDQVEMEQFDKKKIKGAGVIGARENPK